MKIAPPSLHSFPNPFIRALTKNKYSKGESLFTATQLISPPQRTWLAVNHEKKENPYTMFHALMGTAIHSILEENVDPANGEVAEERLYHDYPYLKDGLEIVIPISGQMDFYEDKTVFDYKNTAGIQEKMKPEHYEQVQINGWLAKQNGYDVEHVAVVYLQRDWSYMRSQVDPTYPQTPYTIFVADFDENYAKASIDMKVDEHWRAYNGKPRLCTPVEQWERPSVYAVMTPGAKRASKLCDTHEEAMEFKKPNQIVETRKGEKVYCKNFCGFHEHCEQFKRESMTE